MLVFYFSYREHIIVVHSNTIHCSACIVICIGIIAFNTREEVPSTNDLLLHQPILIHSINNKLDSSAGSVEVGCLQLNNTSYLGW